MSKLARSGLILIVVGLVLGAIAGGIFAYGMWKFVSDDMVARDVVPGTVAMTIDEPGTYTVYYEYRSTLNRRIISTPQQPPGFDMTLRDAAGAEVALEPTRGTYTYEAPSRAGRSVASFDTHQPGDYTLEVATTGRGQEYVITVGQPRLGLFFAGMASLFCGGGLAGLMLLVGIILLVVGLAQGRRTT